MTIKALVIYDEDLMQTLPNDRDDPSATWLARYGTRVVVQA
jgi:hypothetical protein